MQVRSLFVLTVTLTLGILASAAQAADSIILRPDFRKITDRTVTSFDPDGVKLDDGTVLAWDKIQKATLGPPRQASFDELLNKLEKPLGRLDVGLKAGDYQGLLESAEELYPIYQERNSRTAYLVFQSLMWGRLAHGQRAQAVAPYLRCYNYLMLHPDEKNLLPGRRTLQFDPKTGLCSDLPPVWFSAEEAKAALPEVVAAVQQMKANRPDGVYLYYASLLTSAGDAAQADRFLKAVRGPFPISLQLRTIVQAQAEAISGKRGVSLGALEGSVDSMLPETRPLGLYWLGIAKLSSDDPKIQRQGVLQLLYLPALYGEQYPELAAASLYAGMTTLAEMKDLNSSLALRREIQKTYPQTWHAQQLKRDAAKPDAP
ncbi:hypothetical protein [Lignipirellula cremea]|uniref:Tetratricopeptide repeat protein n=1 Tax=Lignipirellula cremea TaxID=2528010 RepID=A0A518DSS4_9BACT|nr:hypothetical protein [Lignipirellula cremea]QDU94892.1 hypothetical protein Pla8534_27000 [Lignipirellula cremea]